MFRFKFDCPSTSIVLKVNRLLFQQYPMFQSFFTQDTSNVTHLCDSTLLHQNHSVFSLSARPFQKLLPHIQEQRSFRIANRFLLHRIISPRRDKTITNSLAHTSLSKHNKSAVYPLKRKAALASSLYKNTSGKKEEKCLRRQKQQKQNQKQGKKTSRTYRNVVSSFMHQDSHLTLSKHIDTSKFINIEKHLNTSNHIETAKHLDNSEERGVARVPGQIFRNNFTTQLGAEHRPVGRRLIVKNNHTGHKRNNQAMSYWN